MANYKTETPAILKIAARLLFIGVILSMAQVFSPDTRRLGDFYPALFSLIIVLRFISGVGVWYMKRWGVELFLITFVAYIIQVLLIPTYTLNPLSFILSLAELVIFIVYYKRMDRNL